MKKIILPFVAALFAVTHTASAALQYWDINGAVAGSGAISGVADGAWGANWSSSAAGDVATTTFTAANTAVFSAGADATGSNSVALAAAQAVGGITVEEGIVRINSSAGTNLTLNTGGIIDVATGSLLHIGSTLAGSVLMTKNGGGSLFLGSGNTRVAASKTLINAGDIIITLPTGLSVAPTANTADSLTLDGGTITLTNNATVTWEANRDITLTASGGTIKSVSGGGSSVIVAAGMTIAGSGTLTKDGPNEWRTSVTANSYSFPKLLVKAGRWVAGSGGSLGADGHFGAVPVSFMADQITLDGSAGRICFNGGSAGTLITLNANRGITITSNGGGIECEGSAARIPGKITGPGVLYRRGTHVLYLSASNDFAGGIRFAAALAGAGRIAAVTGTGPVAIEHNNALGSGPIQFDVAGTVVANTAGLTVPNKHFWNSLTQNYGTTQTEFTFTGFPTNFVFSKSIIFMGDVDTGSVGLAPVVNVNTNTMTFAGTITNTLGFTKGGAAGTMVLSGANTYGVLATNSTFVTAGTLLVNNTAGSGTGLGDVLVTGGTLGGTGTISGGVSNILASISPGTSVGQLNTGSEYWSNTTFKVEINDATGADGVGHDFLNITGTLSLDQTQTVNVVSLTGSAAGNAVNFSSSNPGGYSWKIATASGGINGFDASKIIITTGSFSNATDGGVFSVKSVGNDIFLDFRNPAHVVTSPNNATSGPTGSATFTAVAAGEAPITYTWHHNGAVISDGTMANGTIVSGAGTTSLSLANISTMDITNGSPFFVAVTNTLGGAESATAILTLTDPAVSFSPASLTIGAGSNAVFTVVAQGTPTLAYEWNKGGFPISNSDPRYFGVNSSTLTIFNVSDADEDGIGYDVTVTNNNGAATSGTASLTVVNPPVITAQPTSVTNTGGTTANFTVTATGDTLAYQWRKDGTPLSGKTTSALSLPNVQLASAGSYDVVISNFANTTTSSAATLTVQFTLSATSASPFGTVTRNPSKALYDANESVQITATNTNPSFAFSHWTGSASGSVNPLTISMTTNHAIVGNFTSSIPDIVIDENNANNTGGHTTVTNGAWTASTGGNAGGIQFASPVYSQLGTPTASYKFIPNITTAGNYDVYATYTASAAGGNRGTNVPHRVVLNNSANAETRLNQETNGNVYQLIAAGRYFAAGTNGYAAVENDVTLSAGGDICVADAIKLVYSPTVQDLSSSPTNLVANAGTTATFSVTPSPGAGALTYQWQEVVTGVSTNVITDATNASLVLNSVLKADEGNYRVVVTDGTTTNTTAAATLFVIDPVITSQPASQTVDVGTNVQFSVSASGTSLEYQWKKGGSAIGGATLSSYSIASVTFGDAGNYTVVVSNAFGTVESTTATLTVVGTPAQPTSFVMTTAGQGSFTGSQGATYEVQYADNLNQPVNWLTLTNVVTDNGTGVGSFTDPTNPATRPERYYQITAP